MAEILKFEGDLFWNDDDTESSCNDPDDELDNVGPGDIVKFQQAKRLPNFFAVMVDGKPRYFDTLEEAELAARPGSKLPVPLQPGEFSKQSSLGLERPSELPEVPTIGVPAPKEENR
jgi:hypothetical protein